MTKNFTKFILRFIGVILLLFAMSCWPQPTPRNPEHHSIGFWLLWIVGLILFIQPFKR